MCRDVSCLLLDPEVSLVEIAHRDEVGLTHARIVLQLSLYSCEEDNETKRRVAIYHKPFSF